MAEPIVSWYEGQNKKANEIKGSDSINYGTVESDTASNQKTFFIWNNRNGETDVSKMEDVTFTTKDRQGGTGDTPGSVVEAVRDNWIQVRVDTLAEDSFISVGKDGSKPVGTNGSTKNPSTDTAKMWEASETYEKDDYVKPVESSEYIYRVTTAGTTGVLEPSWSTTAGNVVSGDGTVEYVTVKKSLTPASQEILGVANSVLDDGTNVSDGGGNFIQLTAYADVPVTASSGKNLFLQRISYRYV